MNYLITGAAGFLGSTLANRLVREGQSVRGLDDLSTGDSSVLLPDIHFTRGDVNDRPGLWSILQGVDCVFHLAARVSVPESYLYPRDYNQVNVGGTVTLMEAVRDVGTKRVIFISSGAIYGDQSEHLLQESMIPNPKSPYAISKLAAENYVRCIGDYANVETVCLRVFNAYGPGQHFPSSHPPVIPYFIKQACANGTLIINNDGAQTRDYVYVDDAVNAMVAASTSADVNHAIINIGSGVSTSVTDLAKLVLATTGGNPEIVYNRKADSGVSNMQADISLAKTLLDYTPTINLETGLRLTLERDIRFHVPDPEDVERRR
jgi:UDP-glucose 4-epimerase